MRSISPIWLLPISLFALASCSKDLKETVVPYASPRTFSGKLHDITFQHAEKLSVEESAEEITIHHTVPFTHPDPCDFIGNGEDLKVLTDFKVAIRKQKLNMRDLLKEYSGVTFKENVPLPEEGYIDKVEYGSLSGYRFTLQNEGCGHYEYYFPLGEQETLIVMRRFISEFIPTTFYFVEMHEKYERLAEVILPSEEEKYFEQILITLHVL